MDWEFIGTLATGGLLGVLISEVVALVRDDRQRNHEKMLKQHSVKQKLYAEIFSRLWVRTHGAVNEDEMLKEMDYTMAKISNGILIADSKLRVLLVNQLKAFSVTKSALLKNDRDKVQSSKKDSLEGLGDVESEIRRELMM